MKIKLSIISALFILLVPFATHAASTDNLKGYAWSSNIGWVSFNCTNDNSCGTNNYGVTVASNGTITGYAWSPNVGWISFNSADTSGCPTGTCQATLNTSTGKVTGWARGVGGEDTNPYDAGDWGGWIDLADSNYGVSASGCNWSGYAWGGDYNAYGVLPGSGVIGWLDFSGTGYGVTGTGTGSCIGTLPDLTSSLPGNITLTAGVSTAVPFTISNSNAAATGASFWDTVWFSTTPSIATEFDCKEFNSDVPGGFPAGYSETKSVNETIANPGTYYYEVCADQNQSQVGTIAESDETNNCSGSTGWKTVTVSPASCTPTLSPANPSTVTLGRTSNLVYTEPTACATTCQLSDGTQIKANTGSATTDIVYPATSPTTSYSVVCSGLGQPYTSGPQSITVLAPSVKLTASTDRVVAPTGANAVSLTWTSMLLTDPSNICTVSGNGNVPSWGANEAPNSATPLFDPTPITKQTVYQISCTTGTASSPGTPVTSTAVVNIVPSFTNF